MDKTIVKVTTLKEQDEAFCLSLSIDERLKVLEELNRIGRLAAGYPDAPHDRQRVVLVKIGSGSRIEETKRKSARDYIGYSRSTIMAVLPRQRSCTSFAREKNNHVGG